MNFLELKSNLVHQNKVPSPFCINKIEFGFKWINSCETLDVLKVRNSKNVIKNLNESKKIQKEIHFDFIKNYLFLERMDFMIHDLAEECLIGGVNLNKTLHGYELGKYIGNEHYIGKGIAKVAVSSFLKYVDDFFQEITTIHAKTKKNNFSNIHINESLGFKHYKILEDGFILMQRTKN